MPKFVVETLSLFTAKRDREIERDICGASGVEEYWIVSPTERAVEICYLGVSAARSWKGQVDIGLCRALPNGKRSPWATLFYAQPHAEEDCR